MSDTVGCEHLRAVALAVMMILAASGVSVGFTSNAVAQGTQVELTTVDGTVPDTVESGSTFNVSYNITNTGSNATGAIVDVTLPDEWTATNRFDAGGTYKSLNQSWLWQTINASETRSPTLTVHVPSTAAIETYNISAVVKTSAGSGSPTAKAVTVSSGSTASSSNIRTTIDAPSSVSAGSNFTVNHTVNYTGSNATGLILDAHLPAGWTATNATTDGGTYSAANRTWLWQTVTPNTTKSTALTIAVPAAAANGTYDIASTVKRNRTTTVTATHRVTVETDEDAPPSDGGGEALVPFSETAQPEETMPSSLSGKFRVEESVANATNITLLRNASSAYSVNITAPEGSTNVTFYLQERAISSSQDIADVRMLLDGHPRPFKIFEDVGPGKSPWVGFTVPEFSTRTVTFRSDAAPANFSVGIDSVTDPLTQGDTLTVSATITNIGEIAGTQDITASFGSTTQTQSLTLSSNTSATVEFNFTNITDIPAGETDVTVRSANESASRTITVNEVEDSEPPTAVLEAPSEVVVGENVTFDGSGSTDNTAIANYTFIVSNESVSNESGPIESVTTTEPTNTTVLDATGEYTVSLTVADEAGNSNKTTTPITVISGSPTAKFTYEPKRPEATELISFNASRSTAVGDAEIANYTWEFELSDGGSLSDKGDTVPFNGYDTSGTYDVTLTVTDTEGRTATVTKQVSVSTSDSTPGFGSPVALLALLAVSLLAGRRQL